jgi:Ribbon-helix-helix protein, copG family.
MASPSKHQAPNLQALSLQARTGPASARSKASPDGLEFESLDPNSLDFDSLQPDSVRRYDALSYPWTAEASIRPPSTSPSSTSATSTAAASSPAPLDPVVSVRVRTTTLAELEWLKRRLGMNRSNCIRMAVEHYLAAHRLESVAGEQSRLIQELEGWPAVEAGLWSGDIVRLATPLRINRSRTSDLAVVLHASPWVGTHPTLSVCPMDTTRTIGQGIHPVKPWRLSAPL